MEEDIKVLENIIKYTKEASECSLTSGSEKEQWNREVQAIENLIARNKELEELEELPAYTNYLEEKLMYALGPKHKEFSDMTKCEFAKILRKAFDEKADTYTIKQKFKDYYNNI